MPSDNGLFDVPDPTNFDRNWGQVIVVNNTSAPGWPANPTGWYYEVLAATSPGGPYTPAPLTAVADECSPMPDNLVEINPAQPGTTAFGVGGPGVLFPNTDYWGALILRDADGVEQDRFEIPADDPWTTRPFPTFACFFQDTTSTGTTMILGSNGDGRVNLSQPCDVDTIIWETGPTAAGPWTSSASEDVTQLSPSHGFAGLTPQTTYFARARLSDYAGTEYLVTEPCSFTTLADPVTTPTFDPQPCCDGAAEGGACQDPVAFHRTTSSTGPVEHPGRQYDITLPVNPGFAVQSLQVDAVNSPANIVWDVADPDGEAFRQELTTFMEGRLPAPAVVTITNPNAGGTICGTAAPFQIHIECLRLDENPPNLVELVYNGGQDLILNPAYNENPPLNPPVAQGNYGYHLLARQDDPGPFPGNPPAGRVLCTNTANRGWETNDSGRTFEIWGQDVAGGVTPTPRGTPVQEITSDGPPPGGRSTIWQTFVAPASANFIIRVAHGARDAGEQHRITLDNGDTDDAQNGTLINDVTNPATVYGNPWTLFNQTIPLNGGSTYTLALSTTNPVAGARGGLFTDMRAYIDRPDLRATATTNDDTCTVTVDETTTVCDDELWVPHCTDGNIDTWRNVETGETLTNAAFWGQAPAPVPGSCPTAAGEGEGGSVAANLATSYQVCAILGGVRTTLQRVVIMDPSGGTLADTFIGPDGGPVATPSTYTIGSCTDTAYVQDVILCDVIENQGTVSFLRKYVQSLNDTNQGQINSHRDFDFDGNAYTVQGLVSDCGDVVADREPACWTDDSTGGQVHTGTIRHQDGINPQGWLLFDQNNTLVDPTGVTFVSCSPDPFSTTGLCLGDGTPIAIVTAWHADTGTYIDDGWINLLTGAFSAGVPPVGTRACATPQAIQNSDVLCDVTIGTGEVNGLVIVQYNYNPDGSIGSTILIDAITGDPYGTPVGTITVCPTDIGQPDRDMQLMCDVQANGTVVPLVRDYVRDPNGVIVSFNDYTPDGDPYVATGTVSVCIPRDVETLTVCDNNGPFLRTFTYAPAGFVTGFVDTTIAGAPYVPVGPVTYGCTDPTATAQVVATCEDTASAQFVTGPNLLQNGDFEQSSGVGATSQVGPGWTTQYAACGPSIFAAPCGAQTWAFFTTNAGQVTGGSPTANTIEALGSRSMAVNVGPSLTTAIIEWQNVYLENGKSYEMSADAAIIFGPYDVAMKIGGSGGTPFPLSVPPVGNWGRTTTTFVYTGATGYTSVGLYSNNTTPGGNDHTFDNFELHSVTPARAEVLTPVVYSGTMRSIIDQVVETVNCNDDRRDDLLGKVLDVVTPTLPVTLDSTVQRLTGAGSITIPVLARSVTVTVLAGTASVNLGQGATLIPAGATLTWAVDGAGETLAEAFTFTGVAGSDFIVHTTRQ